MTPHTFHQSLIRPNLLLGCEPRPDLFSGLMAFILIAMSQSWTAAFIGSFIWFSALALLQRMAKADPLMRLVYLRHRRYRAYYAPRSTPFRVNTQDYRAFP